VPLATPKGGSSGVVARPGQTTQPIAHTGLSTLAKGGALCDQSGAIACRTPSLAHSRSSAKQLPSIASFVPPLANISRRRRHVTFHLPPTRVQWLQPLARLDRHHAPTFCSPGQASGTLGLCMLQFTISQFASPASPRRVALPVIVRRLSALPLLASRKLFEPALLRRARHLPGCSDPFK
jgi:hypothetical protein